jgi:hypothetical protein
MTHPGPFPGSSANGRELPNNKLVGAVIRTTRPSCGHAKATKLTPQFTTLDIEHFGKGRIAFMPGSAWCVGDS